MVSIAAARQSVASRVRYNHLLLNTGSIVGGPGLFTVSTTVGSRKLRTQNQALDKINTVVTTVSKSVLVAGRVPSPFMLFRKEQYATAKNESSGNVSDFLKQKWDSLTSTKKEIYTNKAEEIARDVMNKQRLIEEMRQKLVDFVKRPPSAYDMFREEKFASVPGKTAFDRLQKVAAEWKNLKAEQKQKYMSKAEVLRKEFEKRRSGLTEEQKNALKELRAERRMKRVKRLGRVNRNKELREIATKYGRPKKPLSAFGLLLAEMWKGLGNASVVSKVKSVATKWNSLQAAAKQQYMARAKASMEKYKKDLAAWESKMVSAGHKDMVEKFHKLSFRGFVPKNVRIPDEQRQMTMRQKLRAKKAAMRQRKLKTMKHREQRKAKLAVLREKKNKLVSKTKRQTMKKAKQATEKAKMEKQRAVKVAALQAKLAKKNKKTIKTTTPKKEKQQKKGAVAIKKAQKGKAVSKQKLMKKSKAHTILTKKAMPTKVVQKIKAHNTKKASKMSKAN